MKNTLLLFLLLPFTVLSQRIKVNEFDKFIKQRTIETSMVPIKSTASSGLSIGLKSIGTLFYLYLSGYGAAASTISADERAIFLLENDSTVVVRSTGIQTYEVGIGINQNTYNHQYSVGLKELEMLSQSASKSVRKYGIKGYVNIDIPTKNGNLVRKLASMFLEELIKANVIYNNTNTIKLVDVGAHIGDSVTVCGRIFTTRYLTTIKNKPTLLNVGGAYPNQPLTLVIYEEDRKNFNETPESYYKDKEVCVTGRIVLYQDKPQIVLRKPDQISIAANQF